jgi:TRAP-type C4-dicarboxylate transport system permease small subunit
MSDQRPLDPEAAAAIGKVRRMMVITTTATFLVIALVFAVIGYRLSHIEESAPSFADATQALPAGAKVVSTAVSGDHIVVTIEVNGATEILTFDPDTLKPLGRLRLTPKP